MSRFVTIATYTTPLEAELVRGRLEDEGVETFMADSEIVTVDWTMSNAIGGVKVKVFTEDADRALAILAEPVGELEDYEAPTEVEALARRALFASMLGTALPPVQLYTLYLLSRYWAEAGEETGQTRRFILGAMLLMIPSLILMALMLIIW